MKKVSVTVLSCFIMSLLSISSIWAVPIQVDFTASGFTDGSVPAPYDQISGSLTYEAATPNSAIDYLTSIDLTIGLHTYSLSEIDFISPYSDAFFDANVGGITYNALDYIAPGTDDFFLNWDLGSLSPFIFGYSTATNLTTAWTTQTFDTFEVSVVPEPSTFLLLAAGIIFFSMVSLRRKSR